MAPFSHRARYVPGPIRTRPYAPENAPENAPGLSHPGPHAYLHTWICPSKHTVPNTKNTQNHTKNTQENTKNTQRSHQNHPRNIPKARPPSTALPSPTMSRIFQLQLIRKTLGDLGYLDVADVLAHHMASEKTASNGLVAMNPVSELIAKGNYTVLEAALSEMPPENDPQTIEIDEMLCLDQSDDSISSENGPTRELRTAMAALTPNERRLAHYLMLRTFFLEKIVLVAMGEAPPDTGNDAFDFLKHSVSVAFDAINRLDANFPLAAHLSKEREGAALVPLAMNPPRRSQIEAAIFTPSVLLTNVKSPPAGVLTEAALSSATTPNSAMAASPDTARYLARLRHALTGLLRDNIGLTNPDGAGPTILDYIDIPENCLSEIIHKATLYNEAQSLYHLPPRTQRASDSRGVDDYAFSADATRADLPIHLLHTLAHHTDEVWFTRFSPSGRFLATGSLDGTCLIYDVTDNFRLLAELDANAENEPAAFVKDSYVPPLDKKKGIIYFSWEPHERYIVTCCLDTVIRVWNVEGIAPKRRVTRSMNGSESVSLVSCFTLGQRMRTWPCEFLKYDKTATPHFVVGSPDKVLKVYSIDGNEVLDFYSDADEWSTILGEEPSPTSFTATEPPASSSGARRPEETSHVSSEESSSSAAGNASQFNRINDFAITPNGRVLITANNDKQVFFYKIPNLFDPSTTTSRIASLSLNGRLTSCNISADGRYMLLSIAPEELQLWDISPLDHFEKPFLKQKFLGQSQAVYMVRSCFGYLTNPKTREQLVLSGSDDGFIYIWKLETGQLVTRVKGHDGLCNSVDWNRFYVSKTGRDYGMYWCSVGDDQLVKIWGPQDPHVKTTYQT
ncbi:hypothetical protein JCM33374_g3226 [Metschnikowia sp. JCM 33374]|nr:hypothetical protein JCM33374_g3226 [Metschnikowia sp. JCM 33374]